MNKGQKIAVAFMGAIAISGISIGKQAIAAPADDAKAFVKGFYDWYVPIANRTNKKPAWILAIEQKPTLFDDKLKDMLREDYVSQLKNPGYIVGIDFDPFLNSQDPSSHFDVGSVSEKGSDFFVEVKTGTAREKRVPSVVVDVRSANGNYTLANFLYPQNGDLRNVLAELKRHR